MEKKTTPTAEEEQPQPEALREMIDRERIISNCVRLSDVEVSSHDTSIERLSEIAFGLFRQTRNHNPIGYIQ